MSHLTFCAQLSLDFIFGNVKELPKVGEEVLASYFDIQLGGGTLVYPIVLTRLGVDCRVILKRSSSIHADLAYKMLKSYNIHDVVMLEVKDFDAIMSTAVISQKKDRSFISHNDNRALQFDDDFLLQQFKDSKVVFAMEQNADIIPKLRENGNIIVFDVGWSDDLSIKKYEHILSNVDYFTPNDKEALKMTGKGSVEESLRVLQKYVKHPIISWGKNGCVTIQDNQIIQVKIPDNITAIDTTGAGDNFMAGLIYGINKDMDVIECMKFANCTGALSTTKPGCYGANYTFDDVMKLFKKL